jgi:hypothetical protein
MAEHNTLQHLNDMLPGRTIASVEAGTTLGWILLNLAPVPEDEGCRAFMTLRVEEESDPHSWSAAIRYVPPKGATIKFPIRPLVSVLEEDK